MYVLTIKLIYYRTSMHKIFLHKYKNGFNIENSIFLDDMGKTLYGETAVKNFIR